MIGLNTSHLDATLHIEITCNTSVSNWSSICVTNACNQPNSSAFHIYSNSFIKTSGQLIWSMFGLTDLQDLKADTGETTGVVLVLFCIFLIVSVIMLVNMLVALLTTTYDQASVRNLSIP